MSALGTVVAVAIGIPVGGALGVAVALAVRFYVMLPVAASGAWREIDLRLSQALWSLRGALLASAVMGGCSLAIRFTVPLSNPAFVLITQAIVSAGVYVLTLRLVDRTQLADVATLVSGRRGRSRLATT